MGANFAKIRIVKIKTEVESGDIITLAVVRVYVDSNKFPLPVVM